MNALLEFVYAALLGVTFAVTPETVSLVAVPALIHEFPVKFKPLTVISVAPTALMPTLFRATEPEIVIFLATSTVTSEISANTVTVSPSFAAAIAAASVAYFASSIIATQGTTV